MENVAIHRQIISYFGDTPSPQSPFSIQKLISVSRESGKKAGDWYGPSSIANALWYVYFCLSVIIIVIFCTKSN